MRPAFSSTRQAAAFAGLLLLILLLPVLFGKTVLPPRPEIYATTPYGWGCYPFVRQQIYEEKGDIDIAFVGSSHLWTAIDTPRLQAALSKKLGREASVVTLGWDWPGFDALYFITQDLVAKRKVHMLVISEEYSPEWPIPHMAASHWFRFRENQEALTGLPLDFQAAYYADALRGMPLNILNRIRPPNLPMVWPPPRNNWEIYYNDANTERLGSLSVSFGWSTGQIMNTNFVKYTPAHDVSPAEVCVYSSEMKSRFEFTGPFTPSADLYFAKKLAALAQANGIKLVWLHIPKANEMRAPAVPERECWPQILPGDVTLMGIPPAALLVGISDEDAFKLFYNNEHMNKNGQEYFTRAITPALLQLYAP